MTPFNPNFTITNRMTAAITQIERACSFLELFPPGMASMATWHGNIPFFGHFQPPRQGGAFSFSRMTQICSHKRESGLPVSIKSLNDSAINHIALANPKTAPYGLAALEVLKKHGLLDSLENKLVYGESVGQTNQFIYSKSAEIGFTAQAVVLSPEMKGKGNWALINDSDYTPISQGAVVIKQSKRNNLQADKFYKFLFSNEAKIILKDFGYSVDE